jgi:hypothetical protein
MANKDNLGISNSSKTLPTYLPTSELHETAMVEDVEIRERPNRSYAAS